MIGTFTANGSSEGSMRMTEVCIFMLGRLVGSGWCHYISPKITHWQSQFVVSPKHVGLRLVGIQSRSWSHLMRFINFHQRKPPSLTVTSLRLLFGIQRWTSNKAICFDGTHDAHVCVVHSPWEALRFLCASLPSCSSKSSVYR